MDQPNITLFSTVKEQSEMVYELAKRDFQRQYKATLFGSVWIFLQPLILVLVLYTVFTIGFKANVAVNDAPFVLYLLTGMVAWNCFSANLSPMSHLLESHAFLVQNTRFRLFLLPCVTLLSGLLPHLFVFLVITGICWLEGYRPSLYTIQVIYYLFAMQILLLGIGWITSMANAFVQDVSKVVDVLVQFGFWLTPIFWYLNKVPSEYQWIFKLNPVYYVVEGFRDSLIYQVGFWEKPHDALQFWCTSTAFILLGAFVYRRLRPHISELV